MKRNLLLITVIAFFLFSCTARKKAVADIARDGSSFEKAIIINETHERQGVDDEYAWIRANYPGAHTNSQTLVNHEKKSYDILHITTADGKAVAVYFDIDKFFGKF